MDQAQRGLFLFVLPNHDLDIIARRFANLLAYGFEYTQQ
jgi:hypothetical protein